MKKLIKLSIFIACAGFIMAMLVAMAVIVTQPAPMEERLQGELSIDLKGANYVKNALLCVGVDEYTAILPFTENDNKYGFDDKGYVIDKEGAEPIYLNITDSVEFVKITYKDFTLYEPGMTGGNLYDHILTTDELSQFKMRSEKDVKRILKNPSAAVFPLLDGWKYGKIDGEVVIQGYVDAQNSFGAVVRTDFQTKYKAGALVSLIFDGKEYVKY